jgi:hypothetical protein
VVVNSLGDAPTVSGSSISLRAAIGIANASTTPTTITFDPTVFSTPQTITLTDVTSAEAGDGVLYFNGTQPVTITGPAAGVTINANELCGVFYVTYGETVSLSNLTATGGIGTGAGSGGYGGAILNDGTLSLTNVTISGNLSQNNFGYGGGGIDNDATLTMVDCTVSGNTSPEGGGILCGTGTSTTLTNCTIANNNGQGIYDQIAQSLTVNNTTIANNTQQGILWQCNNGSTFNFSPSLTLGNSIVAGNLISGGDVSYFQYPTIVLPTLPVTSLGHNLIGNIGSTTGWVSSDLTGTNAAQLSPALGSLANNGGLTMTMLPQAGSPAIDAGANSLVPAGVTTDQRGLSRISGSSVDIGSVEVQGAAQLSGIPIGTAGSWDGSSTIYKVFDGNTNTFFDPATGSLTNWVGLDLQENATITQIQYAPRAGYEYRMLGGQFQASNTPDFSAGVVTLATITTTPTAGTLTSIPVNAAGYRYVRFTGGTQWVNIAEMRVFGTELPSTVTFQAFSGTPISVGGAWVPSSGAAAAFDGNLSTYFDPANGSLSDYVGLDLGSPKIVTQISFAPRYGYEGRMLGGQFQVSSTADFSSDVHTVWTITQTPASNQITTVNFEPAGAYRYIRYTGGTQWVNIAEMQVAGEVPPVPLTGTAIGTGGSWNPYTTYSAAFDGSTSTFFDPANGNLSNWVGEDLGSTKVVTQIRFAPRAGYEFRMVGGMFQASNTADFSSGVVTLYTITTAPTPGQVATVSVNPTHTAYRYYRYTGGTQWVNIAEMELDGLG